MNSKHTLLIHIFVLFSFFLGHTQSNQEVESIYKYYSEISDDFERIDSLRTFIHPKNGGDMQQSIKLLQMEREALSSISQNPLQHVLLNNLLFKCHRSINEYHKGVDYLLEGKKIADKYSKEDEQWESALAELNLETAFVHYLDQNPKEGFAAATRALNGYKKLGNDRKLAESYWRLGIAKSQMGSSQEALSYYEEAENLIDQEEEAQNYLRVQYLKSIELAIQNRFETARSVLLPILPKMKAIDHPNYAVALAKMGHVETQLGNLFPAKKYLTEAEELKINTTDLNAKAVIAHRFEEYYLAVGEFQNAYDQLAVRKSISDSISRKRIQDESFAFKNRVKEISLQQENKDSKYEEVIQESKWKSWLGLTAGLLLALLGYFWYRKSSAPVAEPRKMQSSIEEVAQVKKDIAKNVTSNLRTPLALISSQLQELKSEVLDVHASLLLNSSIDNSKNLFHKVNDLEDINQFETKSMMKNETDGDLIMFLDEIFQRSRKTRRDKEFIWEKSFEQPHFFCKLDYANLNSILTNLISNAVEYCPSGSKIELAFHQKRDYVVIEVIDNGPGIEPAHQPHVFNWYYNDQTKQEEGGGESGYGLALSKELSGIMNGTLTLDSQENKGCHFALQVPFKKVSPETQVMIDELMLANGMGVPTPVPSEAAKSEALLKLLLVEANEDYVDHIKNILPNNYIVTTFPTASAAESWAMENMPDVILISLELPDMSGFELSKSLKNNILTDHIPIVILTTRDDDELQQDLLDAQANSVLTKPINEVFLHSSLKKISENHVAPNIDIQKGEISNHFFNKMYTIISAQFENAEFDESTCASLMYFSPTLLAKKTKVLVGKTPNDLIEKFRIDQSNQLLEITDMSIEEISAKCGFTNPEDFNSTYQKYNEVSPIEYRTNLTKE